MITGLLPENLPSQLWWLFLLVLAVSSGAIYVRVAVTPRVVDMYDESLYLSLAKSIATGRGYGQDGRPGSIVPAYHVPILYPLTLSLIWKISPDFPANVLIMTLASVVAIIGFLVLSYFFLVRCRCASPKLSAIIILMIAFNPTVVWHSGGIRADWLFCLLSILALWSVNLSVNSHSNPRSWTYLIAAAVLSVLAYFTRWIGVALIIAVFSYLMWGRRFRKGSLFLATTAILSMPWNIWAATGYLEILRPSAISSRWLILTSALHDLKIAIFDLIPSMIFPAIERPTVIDILSKYSKAGPLLLTALSICISVLTMVGYVNAIRRKMLLESIYVPIYLIGTSIPLSVYADPRYLIPILPFIWLYFLDGSKSLINALFDLFHWENKELLTKLSLIGFIVVSLSTTLVLDYRFIDRWPNVTVEYGAVLSEHRRMFDWVKENTADSAVLDTWADNQFYLYTNRKTVSSLGHPYAAGIGHLPLNTLAKSLEIIKQSGVTHITDTPHPFTPRKFDYGRLLNYMENAHPGALEVVYQREDSGERYRIFEVDKDRLLAGSAVSQMVSEDSGVGNENTHGSKHLQ